MNYSLRKCRCIIHLMGALQSEKCSKGHPMSDPNLYHRPDGKRECLTCKRLRNRDRSIGSTLEQAAAKSKT